MPYTIKKKGNKYQIVKKTTGEVVGSSTSKTKTEASVKARYAGERKKGKK